MKFSLTQKEIEESLLYVVGSLVVFFLIFRVFMLVDELFSVSIPIGPAGMGEAALVAAIISVPLAWLVTDLFTGVKGFKRHIVQSLGLYVTMLITLFMLIFQWKVTPGGLEYSLAQLFFMYVLAIAITNFVYHLKEESV
jgi:hypothetical protein